MDSTTPDPKPQQQQQQHQQQQQQPQQQPQHQHQPQPMQQQQPPRPPHQLHQPRPQQPQQQQPPHPHQHQMHPQAGQYLAQMQPPFNPAPYYSRFSQQYAYGTPPYQQVSYNHHPPYSNPPPQAWAQPATFPTVPAQPIPNMVPQQPQTNVPQTHTKPSSQIINPVNNSADQSHTLTLQSVTITNPTLTSAPKSRQKTPATLKNPATKEVIPLEVTSTSQTTTTSTTTTTTTPATAPTTTNIKTSSTLATTTAPANTVPATQAAAAATTTTTTSAPQTTNKGEEKKRLDIKKQEESSPAKIVQTKQQNPAQTLLQHVSEDGLEVRNHPTSTKNGQDTKKVEADTTNVTNDVTSKDKRVSPQTSATKVEVASIPEEEKVKDKVNGNEGDDKNDSCKIVVKETGPKLESPKKVASEVNIDKPSVSTTTTTTTSTTTASSNNGQDSKINKEAEIAKATAATTEAHDGDESSTTTTTTVAPSGARIAEDDGDQKDKECNVNGNDGDQQQGDDSNQKVDQESDSKVELHYEPGQYNPISNRTGKKVYSKQFMLDVCEKICKLSLSPKESDDKIGLENDGLQNAFSERVDMFMPNFAPNRFTPTNRQNEPARRQSQHLYAGRSSAGQEKQRKVITSVSLTQEVELKTVSNPWKRAKDIKEDATNDEVETELLKKKFRSILNKLTPNNFENLAKAVTDLCIDSESKLGEVIDIVFAKALAEPGYCVLYGQMCSHLKKITAGTANFGNTLLKRCQHQFQSDIYSGLNLNERKEKIDNEQDPEVKKQLNEELYEDMFRCRMRGLGLIKFIGELYKIEMLNDQIMFDCVLRLLSDTSEESLECLCDLLTTIGEKLDKSSMKNKEGKEKKVQQKSAPKANAYSGGQKSAAAIVASGTQKQAAAAAAAAAAAQEQQYMITTLDPVFEQLHKIRKNKDLPLSVRIRFKLLDTCELREKESWHSKKTKDNNPKKIEEIREAHKEKLEQERRQVNLMGPRRSQEGRRGLGHQGGSSSQISSMGNESSGSRGAGGQSSSNMHTSSSSHLLRDHSLGDMQMKTNHNDIESHKEHQKKIENLKTMSIFKDMSSSTTNRNSSSSSAEPLRPSSQFRPLRPMTAAAAAAAGSTGGSGGISGGLRPNSSSSGSAATPTTTLSSSSSATASSKPATTAATPPPAGVTEQDKKEDPQQQQQQES